MHSKVVRKGGVKAKFLFSNILRFSVLPSLLYFTQHKFKILHLGYILVTFVNERGGALATHFAR